MRLVEPTDFEVLAFLDRNGRNNAINISTGLKRDRSYVNTRLRELEDRGLVDRIGPANNSGLYELNERGRAALAVRDRYGEPETDFGELVETVRTDR